MCSDSKRLPHLYAVQPNPFAYTQKYEEALDLIHGEIRKLFSNPNLLHTPEIASLMREIADEVAYLRFDNTILRTASPEWSKKFAERELVTQRQAFLETCKLLTDPGGKLTARYQVNMHSGKQNCNTIPCTYAELNKDLTGDRDIGIGWTDISQRSAEEWAAKELMGLRDQLKPLAEEAKKRIKQFLNEYGISDRYRGYRNNLGYFCNSERSRDIDSALLNPARPVIAPRWNLGVEEERAKAVDCTNCVALHDKNCKNSTRRCYFRQIVKDPVEAAGIPLKFPGKTEYEDAFIYPMLRYLPRTAKKPPSTHRSVSEQPPGIRGRGRSVESDVDVMQTRDYVSDPAMITGESHQELWMENRKTCDGFPKTEYQERFRNFSAEDLNPCTWRFY